MEVFGHIDILFRDDRSDFMIALAERIQEVNRIKKVRQHRWCEHLSICNANIIISISISISVIMQSIISIRLDSDAFTQ